MKKIIVKAHSISNSMNNPPITEQLMAGVDLRGNEREGSGEVLIFEDEIKLGIKYYDSKEDFWVTPVRFYCSRVEISDGRSCTIEYAQTHWEVKK